MTKIAKIILEDDDGTIKEFILKEGIAVMESEEGEIITINTSNNDLKMTVLRMALE